MLRTEDLMLSADEIAAMAPSRLVVVLYDLAIDSLRRAADAIADDDIEARCANVTRAMNVIGHLHLTLDMRNGGQIAHNLSAMYGFMLSRLHEVNFRNDPAPALNAIELLTPLREAWAMLDARTARAEAARIDADDEMEPGEVLSAALAHRTLVAAGA